jgi:hypothetical protein
MCFLGIPLTQTRAFLHRLAQIQNVVSRRGFGVFCCGLALFGRNRPIRGRGRAISAARVIGVRDFIMIASYILAW